MKKNEKEITIIRNWLNLIERIESRVLNAKYFNQGLLGGLIIGLTANLWIILFYQQIFIKFKPIIQLMIFIVITLIGIYAIRKLIIETKEFSRISKILKISIPKINNYLLKKQGVKSRGVTLTLNDKEMEEIDGKNWREKRDKK